MSKNGTNTAGEEDVILPSAKEMNKKFRTLSGLNDRAERVQVQQALEKAQRSMEQSISQMSTRPNVRTNQDPYVTLDFLVSHDTKRWLQDQGYQVETVSVSTFGGTFRGGDREVTRINFLKVIP